MDRNDVRATRRRWVWLIIIERETDVELAHVVQEQSEAI
jgi:hypothetical protein